MPCTLTQQSLLIVVVVSGGLVHSACRLRVSAAANLSTGTLYDFPCSACGNCWCSSSERGDALLEACRRALAKGSGCTGPPAGISQWVVVFTLMTPRPTMMTSLPRGPSTASGVLYCCPNASPPACAGQPVGHAAVSVQRNVTCCSGVTIGDARQCAWLPEDRAVYKGMQRRLQAPTCSCTPGVM
jgi:hypothetical protein